MASNKLNEKSTLIGMTGTPLFVAPENIKGTYNEKVDIWSLGISTFFLLTGQYPFVS